MSGSRICGACKWWHQLPPGFNAGLVAALKTFGDAEQPQDVTEWGQCRRLPPRVTEHKVPKRAYIVYVTEFPDMPRAGWCGEWADKRLTP